MILPPPLPSPFRSAIDQVQDKVMEMTLEGDEKKPPEAAVPEATMTFPLVGGGGGGANDADSDDSGSVGDIDDYEIEEDDPVRYINNSTYRV